MRASKYSWGPLDAFSPDQKEVHSKAVIPSTHFWTLAYPFPCGLHWHIILFWGDIKYIWWLIWHTTWSVSRDSSPTAEVGASRLPDKPGINHLVTGLWGDPEDCRRLRTLASYLPTFYEHFSTYLTILHHTSTNQPVSALSQDSPHLAVGPRWE